MLSRLNKTCRALLASACLLAGLGVAEATTLRFVPHADLQALDPMGSTADIVKMHGFLIYDTLYSLDANSVPQPHMVKDLKISDDPKT